MSQEADLYSGLQTLLGTATGLPVWAGEPEPVPWTELPAVIVEPLTSNSTRLTLGSAGAARDAYLYSVRIWLGPKDLRAAVATTRSLGYHAVIRAAIAGASSLGSVALYDCTLLQGTNNVAARAYQKLDLIPEVSWQVLVEVDNPAEG